MAIEKVVYTEPGTFFVGTGKWESRLLFIPDDAGQECFVHVESKEEPVMVLKEEPSTEES